MTEKVSDENNTFAQDVEAARQHAEEFGFELFVRELSGTVRTKRAEGRRRITSEKH